MKILNKLTYRYLKLNKKKSLITIISIVLMTTLIFSLGLGASTIRKKTVDETIEYSGPQHLKLYDLEFSTIDTLNNNSDIKEIALMQTINTINSNDYQINFITVSENAKNYFLNLQGSFPNSDNEIIISSEFAQKENYAIGDTINNKKIVGIFTSTPLNHERYDGDNFYAYTFGSFSDSSLTTFLITFKSTRNAYSKINEIASSLDLQKISNPGGAVIYDNAVINDSLLQANGEFHLLSTKFGVYAIFSTILIVVSVFCVLIVRNAFTISLSERKKQFGTLRSIGASKKQIFKMVMVEACMLSIIAIPLGIILSFLLVSGILAIFNKILADLIVPYQLYLYPEFIIISLIFILLTIFASALYPAIKASLVTPMEAIRLNNVYKIRRSKENYPLIKKVFGVEGEVAYKNMKRNRHKFTSSTISLCISVILFITFATLIKYILVNYATNFEEEYDIYIQVPTTSPEILQEISDISAIDEIVIYQNEYLFFSNKEYLTVEFIENNPDDNYYYLQLYGLDDKTYNAYLNKLKISNNYFGILVNNAYTKDPDTNETVPYNAFINNPYIQIELNTNETIYHPETDTYEYINNPSYLTISNLYLTNEFSYFNLNNPALIVDFDTFTYIKNAMPSTITTHQLYEICINSEHYQEFDREMTKIIEENPNINIGYDNYEYWNYENKMVAISIAFILYSILTFIALISITTVFSSINANIETREKEFSVLRSIGLSKKGLNKMLILEGTFLGLKVLFFSIPISMIIIWFIREALKMMDIISKSMIIPYPTNYLIAAIIVVLVLIFLITMFSVRKIKRKNIVDSIKNENI